ncbi:hypothetical protein MKZ38_001891 [Zalerion maritima]|uniref:Uncharacterized protein n=1 Tax=Zalerion maritima TaxID=339359 RepID=A0AAD5RR75_9PEZI|nr:hypothetical protein MKZ38_001891 [Zalerion maritima]
MSATSKRSVSPWVNNEQTPSSVSTDKDNIVSATPLFGETIMQRQHRLGATVTMMENALNNVARGQGPPMGFVAGDIEHNHTGAANVNNLCVGSQLVSLPAKTENIDHAREIAENDHDIYIVMSLTLSNATTLAQIEGDGDENISRVGTMPSSHGSNSTAGETAATASSSTIVSSDEGMLPLAVAASLAGLGSQFDETE